MLARSASTGRHPLRYQYQQAIGAPRGVKGTLRDSATLTAPAAPGRLTPPSPGYVSSLTALDPPVRLYCQQGPRHSSWAPLRSAALLFTPWLPAFKRG